MANPFLGQIISVGFDFAPVDWLPCDGRLLPIASYEALYSLLGTRYGGDGVNTFALPNLNGRVPLGAGQGTGLSNYEQGQAMGTESVGLLRSNTPSHTHTISFSANAATAASAKPAKPEDEALTVGADVNTKLQGFYANQAGTVPLRKGTIMPSVGGQAHENRQQFLVLNYVIAAAGLYPVR